MYVCMYGYIYNFYLQRVINIELALALSSCNVCSLRLIALFSG